MTRSTRYDNLGTHVDRYTIRNITCAYVALIFSSVVFFGCMVVIVLITQYNYPIKWTFGVYVIGTSSLYLTNFASSIHILFGKKPARQVERRRRDEESRTCFPMAQSLNNEISETLNNHTEQQPEVGLDICGATPTQIQQNKTPPPPYEDIADLPCQQTIIASHPTPKELHSRDIQLHANDTHKLSEAFIEINTGPHGESHKKNVKRVEATASPECNRCKSPFALETSTVLFENILVPPLKTNRVKELTLDAPKKMSCTKILLRPGDQDKSLESENRIRHQGQNLLVSLRKAPNLISENTFRDLQQVKEDNPIKVTSSNITMNSSPPDLIRNSSKSVKRYSKTERDRMRAKNLRDKSSGNEANNTPDEKQTKGTRAENNYWEQPQDLVMSKRENKPSEQTEIASHRPLRKSMTAPEKGLPFQGNCHKLTAVVSEEYTTENPLSPILHSKLLGTVSEGSRICQNLTPQEWIVAWDRSLNKITDQDSSRTFGARI